MRAFLSIRLYTNCLQNPPNVYKCLQGVRIVYGTDPIRSGSTPCPRGFRQIRVRIVSSRQHLTYSRSVYHPQWIRSGSADNPREQINVRRWHSLRRKLKRHVNRELSNLNVNPSMITFCYFRNLYFCSLSSLPRLYFNVFSFFLLLTTL
jgi:hypothetical protein